MNRVTRNEHYLRTAIAICKTKPNFKIAFFIGRYNTADYLLRLIDSIDCVVNHSTKSIIFENGSRIYFKTIEQSHGLEYNNVIFDETANFNLKDTQYILAHVRRRIVE